MKTLDDYEVGAAEEFGSYRLTRDEVIEFASRFDPQAFHLDDNAAAANPIFGRISASGWHTASATMRMIVDQARQSGGFSMGSPGVEDLRWPQPAYPGDTLRVRSEVVSKRRSQTREAIGLVKIRTTTLNQHGETVMSMLSTIIVAADGTKRAEA